MFTLMCSMCALPQSIFCYGSSGGARRGRGYDKNEGLAENLNAAPLCPSREIAATLGSDVFQQGVNKVPCEA